MLKVTSGERRGLIVLIMLILIVLSFSLYDRYPSEPLSEVESSFPSDTSSSVRSCSVHIDSDSGRVVRGKRAGRKSSPAPADKEPRDVPARSPLDEPLD